MRVMGFHDGGTLRGSMTVGGWYAMVCCSDGSGDDGDGE